MPGTQRSAARHFKADVIEARNGLAGVARILETVIGLRAADAPRGAGGGPGPRHEALTAGLTERDMDSACRPDCRSGSPRVQPYILKAVDDASAVRCEGGA